MCEWNIDKLISFHTDKENKRERKIAGYADWFKPEEIQHIPDWVKYLN